MVRASTSAAVKAARKLNARSAEGFVANSALITSFAAQVTGLQVGETASKAYRLTDEQLVRYTTDGVAMKDRHRRAHLSTVSRAKEVTGNEYRFEVDEMMTASRNFYIVILITRTK